MYQPLSQKVTVKDNETIPLILTMQPNFGILDLNATNDADLYINNQLKGTGNWKGKLTAGVYTLEARKDKYRTVKQDIEVVVGDDRNVTLTPLAINGSLDVITNPPGASISLNGKDYGTTPNSITNLLIGEYKIIITKSGYGNINKTITINENEISELNEALPTGIEITITSTPLNAKVFLNGNYQGKTPLTVKTFIGKNKIKLTKSPDYLDYEVEAFTNNNQNLSFDLLINKLNENMSERIYRLYYENDDYKTIIKESLIGLFFKKGVSAVFSIVGSSDLSLKISGIYSDKIFLTKLKTNEYNSNLYIYTTLLSPIQLSNKYFRMNFAGAGLGCMFYSLNHKNRFFVETSLNLNMSLAYKKYTYTYKGRSIGTYRSNETEYRRESNTIPVNILLKYERFINGKSFFFFATGLNYCGMYESFYFVDEIENYKNNGGTFPQAIEPNIAGFKNGLEPYFEFGFRF